MSGDVELLIKPIKLPEDHENAKRSFLSAIEPPVDFGRRHVQLSFVGPDG
jgi:hypothetical protein